MADQASVQTCKFTDARTHEQGQGPARRMSVNFKSGITLSVYSDLPAPAACAGCAAAFAAWAGSAARFAC